MSDLYSVHFYENLSICHYMSPVSLFCIYNHVLISASVHQLSKTGGIYMNQKLSKVFEQASVIMCWRHIARILLINT